MNYQIADPFLAVEIEIHAQCNRSCSYCPNSISSRPEQGEMDLSLFKLLISQLKDISFKGRISYHFYNEPLLNKNFPWMVEYTRKNLPQAFIVLFSNGTLLTENIFYDLLGKGVDRFIITKHEGVNKIPMDKFYDDLAINRRDQIVRKDFERMDLTNRGGMLEHINSKRDTSKLPCFIPRCVLVVSVEGNVLTCFEDFLGHTSMGNIKDQHIAEIWSHPAYRELRANLASGRRSEYAICSKCNNEDVIPTL